MQLKIELDNETTSSLIREAVLEKRNIARQAEVIIRRALGLPFPYQGIIDLPPTPTKQEAALEHA